jgi:hypothetical protein
MVSPGRDVDLGRYTMRLVGRLDVYRGEAVQM